MSEERTELTGKGGFIRILVERANPAGDLNIPDGAKGIVIFVHRSGSSHLSPRNRFVASEILD